MPGPLSCTPILNRLAAVGSMWTQISGRMPASSQASSELSTASLTVVSSAFRGLSKPSRWRFLVKNSLTEISAFLPPSTRRWHGGGPLLACRWSRQRAERRLQFSAGRRFFFLGALVRYP